MTKYCSNTALLSKLFNVLPVGESVECSSIKFLNVSSVNFLSNVPLVSLSFPYNKLNTSMKSNSFLVLPYILQQSAMTYDSNTLLVIPLDFAFSKNS